MRNITKQKNSNFKAFCEKISYSYDKICKFLQKKYGIPKYPYFSNNQFKSTTHQNLGSKGLIIHHYYEKKAIMLCNKHFAKYCPFSYQEPKNLIICDQIEHLLLHLKIWYEYGAKKEKYFSSSNKEEIWLFNLVGIGGVINFIIPQIIDGFILGTNFFKGNQIYMNKINERILDYGNENIERFIVELFRDDLKRVKSFHGRYYHHFNKQFDKYVNKILKKYEFSKLFNKNSYFQKIKANLYKRYDEVNYKNSQIIEKFDDKK